MLLTQLPETGQSFTPETAQKELITVPSGGGGLGDGGGGGDVWVAKVCEAHEGVSRHEQASSARNKYRMHVWKKAAHTLPHQA